MSKPATNAPRHMESTSSGVLPARSNKEDPPCMFISGHKRLIRRFRVALAFRSTLPRRAALRRALYKDDGYETRRRS